MTKAFENGTGGLVLIGTSNPSAASSVTFTNLTFGKRYRVLVYNFGSVDGEQLSLRFRENTTDKTTGYNGGSWYIGGSGAGAPYVQASNASSIVLGRHPFVTNERSIYHFDLQINPSGDAAEIIGNGYSAFGRYAIYLGFANVGMSDCNGFTIYPVSGTITGTIKLYEYR